MALILALNPGNSHSPTLSRLARELHGCELIGAESCVVAISAIKARVPDVILLPAKQARGQADLMAYLKSIPGGVFTLTLPAVESADPSDLAKQIRAMLTGVAIDPPTDSTSLGAASPELAPVGASPHLLAAATAAINWVRTRRAQWVEQPGNVSPEPVAQWTGVSLPESDVPDEPALPHRPHAPDEPSTSSAPQSHAPSLALKTWLPRAAALAVIIGIVGALLSCWPQIGLTSNEPEVVPLEVDFAKP